jgi:hypothetical protein
MCPRSERGAIQQRSAQRTARNAPGSPFDFAHLVASRRRASRIKSPNQTYIAVVLAEDIDAERRLRQLILAIDDMMIARGMVKERAGAVPKHTLDSEATAPGR